MTKPQIPNRTYDLEERTYRFSRDVALFVNKLPRTPSNFQHGSQVVRSSGSIGANYIEANEALSRKDFVMRTKICRKEAKESGYWLRLISDTNEDPYRSRASRLATEAGELKKIFSSIVEKSK